MYHLVLVATLLGGCAHCDYTVLNVPVCLSDSGQGPEQEYLKEATLFFLHELAELTGKDEAYLTDYFSIIGIIRFADEPLIYKKDKKALGLYVRQGYGVHIYLNDTCISRTAYFHELGHHFRQLIFNKPADSSHSDTVWWAENGYVEKIEVKYFNSGDSYNCKEQRHTW
jgi:hypothetical protein